MQAHAVIPNVLLLIEYLPLRRTPREQGGSSARTQQGRAGGRGGGGGRRYAPTLHLTLIPTPGLPSEAVRDPPRSPEL